ncbi:MAG: GTPase ObgE [Bacteroidia bacterium]|nr:GTPase ObgE [Bacteroidia bacterium]MDW8133897.1 GTPase ObgE [Bacteroidia bacterium]
MQAESDFVDYVKLRLEAGDGGRGVVSWRREKYVPFGGPDGGDGGDGGSIWMEGDPQKWTLLDIKYRRVVKAPSGEAGKPRCQRGANGEDIVIRVPIGTSAWEEGSGAFLGEVLRTGERVLLAKGGKGGRGNYAFRSPTLRAPDFAEAGEPGEKKVVRLELRLLADVCMVGPPNAGKSTLLSILTRARPKIAPYPFTTLVPQLGVVEDERRRSFVLADLPGLIEGASQGKGLGLRFLRHVERGAILLYMLPLDHPNPALLLEKLQAELKTYHPLLLEKPYLIALTKADLVPIDERKKLNLPAANVPQFFISAVTREGIEELLSALRTAVERFRGKAKVQARALPS